MVLVLSSAFLFTASTPVAASVSIDLEIDGEPVEDGDVVDVEEVAEVAIQVESDDTLNFVRTSLGTEEYSVGVDATEYRVNQTLVPPLGQSHYTVYAETLGSDSASKSVTLDRPPANEAEFRQVLRQQRNELERMQQQMTELREHRENLSAENERLRQEIEEVEEEDGVVPLPGFGFGVALAALAALTFGSRRLR